MGLGHISWGGRGTDAAALRTRRRPPSRMTRSRPHSAQNTCATIDWCGSRSVYTDKDHQEIEKREYKKTVFLFFFVSVIAFYYVFFIFNRSSLNDFIRFLVLVDAKNSPCSGMESRE